MVNMIYNKKFQNAFSQQGAFVHRLTECRHDKCQHLPNTWITFNQVSCDAKHWGIPGHQYLDIYHVISKLFLSIKVKPCCSGNYETIKFWEIIDNQRKAVVKIKTECETPGRSTLSNSNSSLFFLSQ